MPQSERHALVVGGGTMGVGIIAMFLGHGWKTDVVSRSATTRDGLTEACGRALAAMGKPVDTSGLATYATLPEASWPAIDIVVETVSEDLALKQKLFAEMEALARPGAAITSNSSSFPISQIARPGIWPKRPWRPMSKWPSYSSAPPRRVSGEATRRAPYVL